MVRQPTDAQISVIKEIWKLAGILKSQHPEMADLYRQGDSHRKIVEDLFLAERYEVEQDLAIRAVGRAIAGHKEGWGFGKLEGLIGDQAELRHIAAQHRISNGRKTGKSTLENRTGVHAQTRETRVRIGRETYENGKGVFRMSKRELSQAGRKGIISLGKLPWKERTDYYEFLGRELVHSFTTYSEQEYLWRLSDSQDYRLKSGTRRGNRDLEKIRDELNRVYHNGEPVRSLTSIQRRLSQTKPSQAA